MGAVTKAIERFKYVRDHAEKETLKESAIKWLEAAEKQKRTSKPYSLYMKIGYQFDNNVRLEPLDEDM
jgi:hypothetical protein